MNLHDQYLVSDIIATRLDQIGLVLMYSMSSTDLIDGERVPTVKVAIDYDDVDGKYLFDADREQKVNEFLELFPDVTVTRDSSYPGARPDMKVRGVIDGIRWEIDFHSGVCEQVQVGTRTVERLDPEVVRDLPYVTVEEPVYEYRCADPILAAGLAS